jgi:hypothetical protein
MIEANYRSYSIPNRFRGTALAVKELPGVSEVLYQYSRVERIGDLKRVSDSVVNRVIVIPSSSGLHRSTGPADGCHDSMSRVFLLRFWHTFVVIKF